MWVGETCHRQIVIKHDDFFILWTGAWERRGCFGGVSSFCIFCARVNDCVCSGLVFAPEFHSGNFDVGILCSCFVVGILNCVLISS